MESQRIKGQCTYLQEVNKNAKGRAKIQQWRLGGCQTHGSRSLVCLEQLGEENGVKEASPLPFLSFMVQTCTPRRANFGHCFFFFCKISLQKFNSPCYACCHNLPFGGRATRGSWVHLPREENAWSCLQCLFEENVGKTKMLSTNFNRERFESCIYARGRYQHPTHPSQGMTTFN